MMLVGCLSGTNMTYLCVRCRTVPPLFAFLECFEVTMTLHPTGKSVGQVILGAGCSTISVAAASWW